jgi:tetratricopeptide (TPR) repeat protein
MPTIISLILIGLCLLIILAIIVKKFPALAILDVNNMSGAKEAKFKDQLIKAKVERDLTKFAGSLARVWLFLSKRLAGFLKSSQATLKKTKLNYKIEAKIPWPEKIKRIKELFAASEELIKKEFYGEAEEKLVEIISLDQKNLKAFFVLAGVYHDLKKWPEARQTYEYALKLARANQDDSGIMEDLNLPEIYFSLAWTLKEADDLETALENCQEALELEPNNPRYLDLILDLSIMKKDKELANKYLEKLAAVNPENNKLIDWQEKIKGLK